MDKTVFDLYKGKKIEEHILHCCRLKNVFFIYKLQYSVDFRVTVNGWPCDRLKGNIKTCNFIIGVRQQFGTT